MSSSIMFLPRIITHGVSMKFPCFMIAIFLLTVGADSARADAPSSDRYEVPAWTFSKARNMSLHEHGYTLQPRMDSRIPALMLFSPTGKMVANVTGDESMDTFKDMLSHRADIVPVTGGEPDVQRPDWVIYEEALANSANVPVDSLKPDNGNQWIVLLVTSSFPGCNHCAQFEEEFEKIGSGNSPDLRAISISMVLD